MYIEKYVENRVYKNIKLIFCIERMLRLEVKWIIKIMMSIGKEWKYEV